MGGEGSGEPAGHEFRGNQYTSGGYTGKNMQRAKSWYAEKQQNLKGFAKAHDLVESSIDVTGDDLLDDDARDLLSDRLLDYKDDNKSFGFRKIQIKDDAEVNGEFDNDYNGGTLTLTKGVFTKEGQKIMDGEVRNQYWVPGANSAQGIIDHEIGHKLSHEMDNVDKHKITALVAGKDTKWFKDNICAYAQMSEGELLAEGWTEYKNSKTPRPLAKEIGKALEFPLKKQRLGRGK
jgi:hypothetical protein